MDVNWKSHLISIELTLPLATCLKGESQKKTMEIKRIKRKMIPK